MRQFFFWQPMLSIHENAFLAALAERFSVHLVLPHLDLLERQREGWNVPDFGKTQIHALPDAAGGIEFFREADSIHVFSGLDAGSFAGDALRRSLAYPVRRMALLEPYRRDDGKAPLRWLKYRLLGWKYAKSVEAFCVTGKLGLQAYRSAGFPAKKLFEWGYFVGNAPVIAPPPVAAPRTRHNLIFIGTMTERKNVLALVETLLKHRDKFHRVVLIGSGPLEDKVQALIAGHDEFEFHAVVPNAEIRNYLAAADELILPSRFDGWGAVINEALACGTRVIASENCGAATLLNGANGSVFSFHGKENLEAVLLRELARPCLAPEARESIRSWAAAKLSGSAAADYFLKICDCAAGDAPRPVPPWANVGENAAQ